MRNRLSGLVVLAAALSVSANEPKPAANSRETREIVYLDGAKIGSFRIVVQEAGDTGRFRATSELDLSFRCYGTAVRMRREFGTEETSDGRIFSLYMKQLLDGGRQLNLTGTVEGNRLHVVVDAGKIERRLQWSDEVLGLAAQERFLTERRPKAGDRLSFLRYEPSLNTVVMVRVAVKELEEVGPDRRKLLRVELKPDRIEVPGTSVQPPGSVVWLDDAFQPVRREMELDGVGKVLCLRATKQTVAGAQDNLTDIGTRTLVRLDRRINNPHATRSAVYRITLKDEPSDAFVQDGHQDIRNVRGRSFELHVHPVRPVPGSRPGPAPDEFLSANYFIDSSDARVRALARRAAGNSDDAWAKAVRIERWVSDSMRIQNGKDLVPASQIARELAGDCRAYALLTAALCRAEGIPSRTAMGLIYVERNASGPKLGFHMWTEVCIGGRWIGLDSTLGQGGIGACHLKICDHSWVATRSLTPLLPVERVLGKIAVEVVRVDGENQ
jgi:transglutaminase-like putative cysteine protease